MLKLIDVSKTFNPGTITERVALKNINLNLEPGDFVTVIGGNGAGKSTLLNLISGVYTADTGSIILDNINITSKKEHSRAQFLGRVFQDPMMGTASTMQIEENLALAYRRGKKRQLLWGVTQAERKLYHKTLAQLDLGLEERMHSKVGLLSGGQRQALTLLMATLKKPKLLLLDEHTAALDPKTAKRVLDLTEEIITRDNLTTFMVTHNMRHAIHYGNRLIMMHEGNIIYDVSGDEKKNLEVSDLLKKFETVGDEGAVSDRMILNN
ncbi:MAG: ATP-binding cassette domain-containing protein [Spirochaetales bacterium]